MTSNGISGILLAAGLSSRMGELKPLLLWQGVPLICYQIEQMQKAGISEIIVVLGHQAHEVERAITQYDVKTVLNNYYQQGKSTSICTGVACLNDDTEGILVSAVDQPVDHCTLKRLMQHLKVIQPAAVVPVYQGKRGHPILFNKDLKTDLLAVNEESKGLRNVIEKHQSRIAQLPVNDSAILLNFNKPGDYLINNKQGGIQ